MRFDDLLQAVGEFGSYQKRVYFLLCLLPMLCGVQVLSNVFLMAIPSYRCKVPGYDNDTWHIQNSFHEELVNRSIPRASSTESSSSSDQISSLFSQCQVYTDTLLASRSGDELSTPYEGALALHGWLNTSDDGSGGEGRQRATRQCGEWVYDRSELKSTAITEFDVVCEDTVYRSICYSVTFAGALIGSILMGIFADIYGRKRALMLSLLIQFITSLAVAFTPNFASMIAIKSLSGFATHSLFAIAATMGMELVGPGKRTFTGIVVEIAWAAGVLLVLPIVFFIRNWRHAQLVICLLGIPLFSLWWLLPESPRFLLSEKRYSEAERVFERICRANKTKLPQGVLHEDTASDGPQARLSTICTSRVLIGRTAVIFVNWLAVNLLYYGLCLYTDNLGGSKYLNYLLGAGLEALAYFLCLFLLDRTGRRTFHCFCMLVGGAACLATVIPLMLDSGKYQWVVTSLSLLGRMFASGAYAILYIMSAELFPTVVRNSAIGVCCVFESIGGMVSPYIADLGLIIGGPFSSGLPMLIFGSSSLIAGILSLTLPETQNKPLPETIEDAINYDKPRKTPSPSNAFISPMLDCNSCTPLSSSQL